ncbi:MAG: ATP-dependent zinc metalloprotease FtsH [Candidatus Hatepunaea meridiana]|nr:ATP-dependent zinc metalloprotease FtsH [Candidatus Hatepunaea meridiana]
MKDKNLPSNGNNKNGRQKQRKRRNDSGDKFDWRKATRTLLIWTLLVIGAWLILSRISLDTQKENRKSYSQYLILLEGGFISKADIVDREFHGVLNDGTGAIVTYLPFINSEMLAEWDSLGIDYQFSEKPTSWLGVLIANMLPWILIIAIWIYIMRRMQGGGSKGIFSFGKSRAKLNMEDKLKVTFKDVAGVDEAKEELQEIIEFLRDPKKFTRLGGRLPKGGLLLGPPGTGKTLLARAVAGEAEVPFFSMSGADFVEMFVGVGAARVRDLFEQGKKNAPCIIFIDEIDAVGRHRGAGLGGGHDEREQTLNQLLVEMDGFESSEGVILIAATNRPDVLDPALTRPGRFDRQIVVDRPDVRGREGILKVHSREIPLGKDVNLNVIAKGTPGLAGADIANMVNEAALLAARHNAKKVSMIDFENAKDKIMMGIERKSILISEEEKKQTAYHEAGHVLVSKLTPGSDPVHKVTIIPRGRALGLTHFLPLDEKHNYSKTYLKQSLNHLLGGRAAEKLVFNELSTGAGNDIERATKIARKMVCEWGMSDKIGPVTYGHKQEEVFLGRDFAQQRNFSERTAQDIDQEIRLIVKEAEKQAENIIGKNLNKLKMLAEALLEREILDGNEVDIILRGDKLRPVHSRGSDQRHRRKATQDRKPIRKVKDDTTRKVKEDTTRKVKDDTTSEVKDDTTGKTPTGRIIERPTRTTRSPAAARRELARSYGIASSRDPKNRRPGPAKQARESSKDKDKSHESESHPEAEKQKNRTSVTRNTRSRSTTVSSKDTVKSSTTRPVRRKYPVKPKASPAVEDKKPKETVNDQTSSQALDRSSKNLTKPLKSQDSIAKQSVTDTPVNARDRRPTAKTSLFDSFGFDNRSKGKKADNKPVEEAKSKSASKVMPSVIEKKDKPKYPLEKIDNKDVEILKRFNKARSKQTTNKDDGDR